MNVRHNEGGFTLIELAVSVSVVVIGIVALGGVIVSTSRQREAVAAKNQMVQETQSLFEIMKGTSPEELAALYDGKTYEVGTGTSGTQGYGGSSTQTCHSTITVDVDTTNEKLPVVTLVAQWPVGDHTETMELRTDVYSVAGNSTAVDPSLNANVTWDADIIDPMGQGQL